MKIKVTLKDPDVLHDAVEEAVEQQVKAMSLPDDEANEIAEVRMNKIMAAMRKWWEYSEYLTVEFDMEAMTAQVIERK